MKRFMVWNDNDGADRDFDTYEEALQHAKKYLGEVEKDAATDGWPEDFEVTIYERRATTVEREIEKPSYAGDEFDRWVTFDLVEDAGEKDSCHTFAVAEAAKEGMSLSGKIAAYAGVPVVRLENMKANVKKVEKGPHKGKIKATTEMFLVLEEKD